MVAVAALIMAMKYEALYDAFKRPVKEFFLNLLYVFDLCFCASLFFDGCRYIIRVGKMGGRCT